MNEAFRYVEATHPVSQVVRLEAGAYVIMSDPLCEGLAGIFTDGALACALWQFQRYTPPVPIPLTEDPIYETIVG